MRVSFQSSRVRVDIDYITLAWWMKFTRIYNIHFVCLKANSIWSWSTYHHQRYRRLASGDLWYYDMAEASILCIVSLVKSLASSSSILKYSSTQLLPPELLGTSHALISLHCRGSSTTLSISCTRKCRSSDFIAGGVLVSACRTSVSLLHITFGRKKPGVARISGIFRVRLSLSMWWKAVIPRWPLQSYQKKSLNFCSRTYSPMFTCWPFLELQAVFESPKCIARR